MVFDAIVAIFIEYGLAGLLFSSFISSLVFFPAYASLLIPLYIKLHFDPFHILFIITIGAVAGEIINYYLGYAGSKYIYKKEMKKAEKWLSRWGELSVFMINLIPVFPADIVNVLVGFLRMDFKMFLVGMLAGKVVQYALLIFGVEVIFKYVSLL